MVPKFPLTPPFVLSPPSGRTHKEAMEGRRPGQDKLAFPDRSSHLAGLDLKAHEDFIDVSIRRELRLPKPSAFLDETHLAIQG